MRALDAAQIDADLALELGIERLAEIMRAAARIRPGSSRRPRVRTPSGRRPAGVRSSASRGAVDGARRASAIADWSCERRVVMQAVPGTPLAAQQVRRRDCRSASRLRWSPAGRSSVQSPASTRLRQRVAGAGRLAFCSGVAAKVARRSRTICHGGNAPASPATLRHLAPDRRAPVPRAARRASASAPLIVTDSRSGNAKIHSAVPLTTPIIGGEAGRRIDAEMRVDDGAELGRRSTGRAPAPCATQGGTARTTASPAPSAIVSSPKSSAATRSFVVARARAAAAPKRTSAPCVSTQMRSAGSMKASPSAVAARSAAGRPGRRAASVSRMTAPASAAGAVRRLGVERREKQAARAAARTAGLRSA